MDLKENKLLVATGWYADREKHKIYQQRSRLTWAPNWLRDYWQPQIEKFLKPDHYFCYISRCEIMPSGDTFSRGEWDYVIGHEDARRLDHRHGFHASLMVSLQYSYCESMDWLFIEQDCLVHGLDKVVDWARGNVGDKLIIYGWKPWWFQKDWAEQSLMFVPCLAIPTVLYIINRAMVHTVNAGVPEMTWHNLFRDHFMGWPFGYGRQKVDDWTGEMFYKQQVTDEEIQKFMELR